MYKDIFNLFFIYIKTHVYYAMTSFTVPQGYNPTKVGSCLAACVEVGTEIVWFNAALFLHIRILVSCYYLIVVKM